MKTTVMRILLVIMFGAGCGLFFYGLADFSGFSQSVEFNGITGGFSWSPTGRHFIAIGSFLMGIPIAFRFTR